MLRRLIFSPKTSQQACAVFKCTRTTFSISWQYPPASTHATGMFSALANSKTIRSRFQVIVADINQTLVGWYGYFKHARDSELGGIDRWIRMRLRSILRKRRGCKGRGRGRDHQRWPNRYFTELGLFCLLEAKVSEIISLRYGANY